MNVKTMIAAAATVASVTAGAATTVTYDASEPRTSYADGALGVTYNEGGALSGISADPDKAGGIDITGDEMTLAPASDEPFVTMRSVGTLRFSNPLRAAGGSSGSRLPIVLDSALTFSGVVQSDNITADTALFAPGVPLAALTNITALVGGEKVGNTPRAAVTCFLENNGSRATCQFQLKIGTMTVRAVVLELTQKDDGVYAKVVGYGHISVESFVEGDVFFDKDVKNIEGGIYADKATYQSGVNNVFKIEQLTMHYDVDVAAHTMRPEVSFAAANELDNVDMVLGGDGAVSLKIDHINAFPKHGSVVVSENSKLSFTVGTTGKVLAGVDNGVPITVYTNGILEAKTAYVFDADDAVFILDGGTFAVNCGTGADYDPSVYVHDITFRNGARATGSRVRVRSEDAVWKVEGDSPSACDIGMYVWTLNAKTSSTFKYSRFTIDVADVADGTDFFLNGPVSLPVDVANYGFATLVKTGAGTMRVGAAFAMTNMPTRIEGGTFLVDGDRLHPQCPFVLAGGALAVSAGSSNVCGSLSVESASTLAVEPGASIAFSDCSEEQTWSGILTVDADLSACTVRFGTDAAGLSAAQRIKLRTADGGRVRLDETGRLLPVGSMTVILR